MALTDDNMVMPVQPMGGGYGGYNYPVATYPVMPYGNGGFGNGFDGFGGDWIILFLFAMMFGGWGNGFGGGFGGWGGGFGNMFEFPWLLNGQNMINANTNDGFRTSQLQDSVTSVRDGVSNLATQLCGCCGDIQMAIAGTNQNISNGTAAIQNSLCQGFAGTTAAVTGAQNAITQQMYNNEINSLERSFAAQTANTAGLTNLSQQLSQCCCDNRAATQDVKYTIATEACATRAANTQNTQAILDKLCQLELDGYKRENDQLRSQLQFANMQASQVAQTAEIRTNNATVANQLVAELRSCPIPAQPVYGNQPIFTCSSANTCGCGCGVA